MGSLLTLKKIKRLKSVAQGLAATSSLSTKTQRTSLYDVATQLLVKAYERFRVPRCGLIRALDQLLANHGFTRVDTVTTFSNLEGDALYIKEKFIQKVNI